MSTKITLSGNEFVHVYNEVFDEENAFIEFNISDKRLSRMTVAIDASTAIIIYAGLQIQIANALKNAYRTDEQIMTQVKKQVEKRNSKGGIYSIMGEVPYGPSSDPLEEQISRGFNYFKSHRDKYKEMVDKALSLVDDKDMEESILSIGKEKEDSSFDLKLLFMKMMEKMSALPCGEESSSVKKECIEFISESISDSKSTKEQIEIYAEKIISRMNAIIRVSDPILFELGE